MKIKFSTIYALESGGKSKRKRSTMLGVKRTPFFHFQPFTHTLSPFLLTPPTHSSFSNYGTKADVKPTYYRIQEPDGAVQ